MVIAEILFEVPDAAGQAEESVDWLLAAWFKNGQIGTDSWYRARTHLEIRVIAPLPEADSLNEAYANEYVRALLLELAGHGGKLAGIRVLGPDPAFDNTCGCPHPPSYILFTTYLHRDSPLRCGGCFGPVPLYRVPPIRGGEHLVVLQWASDYRACDTLQMHTSTGERFGEGQLARHDSSLSRNGRGLAADLTAATHVPVYYNLFKSRGRTAKTEQARLCPSCGGTWRLGEPWHRLFDFRCDRCHLLSNIARTLRS